MKLAGILSFVLGICVAITAAGKLSSGKELDLNSDFQKTKSQKLAKDATASRETSDSAFSEADEFHAMGEVFEQAAERIDSDKTVSGISNFDTQKVLLKLAKQNREQAMAKRKSAKSAASKAKSTASESAELAKKQTETRKAAAEASGFPSGLTGFGGGFVLCAVGLFLWWKTTLDERRVARAAAHDTAEGSELGPVQLVEQLLQPLKDLEGDIESLSGPELCQRVESIVDQFVTPLAEGRQRFVDRFGLAGGSEALNATAFGERMLNRVWSAAADGHLEEARSSFTEVVAAFHQAEETVTRLAQA